MIRNAEIAKARIVADAVDKYAAAREMALPSSREIYEATKSPEEKARPETLEDRVEISAGEASDVETLDNKLIFDVDETEGRFGEVTELYPGAKSKVVLVRGWSPEIAKKIEADGHTRIDQVPAFYDVDTGTAYFNILAIRPSRVDALYTHEILSHAGVRGLLGDEKAEMFYRRVFDEFRDSPAMEEVVRKYGLAPLDAYNDPMFEQMNDAARAVAGEEFFAVVGEETLKPGTERSQWYTPLLIRQKMFLQRFLPQLHFTMNDLEKTLAASAYRLRRQRAEVARGRGEEVRMAVEGSKNADRTSASSSINSGNTGGSPLGANEDIKHAVTQKFDRLIGNIPPDETKIKDVLKRLQTIAEEIVTKHRVTPKNFITTAEYAGFTRSHGGGSSYLHIGDNAEIRLADHPADADTFKKTGENSNNISIVIRRHRTKPFNPDDNVNLLELQFNRDDLSNDRLLNIVQDIAEFIATGEYHDNAGARHYDFSGTEKFVLETIDRLYQDALKRNDPDAAQRLMSAKTQFETRSAHGIRKAVSPVGQVGQVEAAPPVESEQFKAWFKQSKVVNEDGDPLVVYHDTNAKIYVNKETGENWDELDWKAREEWEERDDWDEHWEERDFYTFSRVRARRSIEYPGFFFSPKADPYHEYGSRRIAAYLSIQNPAINPTIENAGVYDDSGEAAMKKLIKQGYDGVIRTDENGNVEEYVAFYPEQIKSATDNVGTFDPKNPDVRYSIKDDDAPLVEPKPFNPASVDYEDADQRAVQVLMARYATASEFDDHEAADYLHGAGFEDITPEQAHKLVVRAREEYRSHKQAEISRNNVKRRDDWLYDNVPLYRHAVDFGGKGFRIRLSEKLRHPDDKGYFIAKKDEPAVNSEELAKYIARVEGRQGQEKEIEEELADFFRSLKKSEFNDIYHRAVKETKEGEREVDRQAKEECRGKADARAYLAAAWGRPGGDPQMEHSGDEDNIPPGGEKSNEKVFVERSAFFQPHQPFLVRCLSAVFADVPHLLVKTDGADGGGNFYSLRPQEELVPLQDAHDHPTDTAPDVLHQNVEREDDAFGFLPPVGHDGAGAEDASFRLGDVHVAVLRLTEDVFDREVPTALFDIFDRVIPRVDFTEPPADDVRHGGGIAFPKTADDDLFAHTCVFPNVMDMVCQNKENPSGCICNRLDFNVL